MIDDFLISAIIVLVYVLAHMLYNRCLGKDELDDLFGIRKKRK